jgi:hypothetical protein
MFVLQASGSCYSWRLPPPRWLGSLWLHWSTQGDCAMLQRRICEGYRAHPAGAAKRNTSRVSLSYPHFWGRFLRCPTCRLGRWCQLVVEPPSEQSTQRGLAYWQIREPQEKNHCVSLVLAVCLQSPNTSLYLLLYISCTCVVVVTLITSCACVAC